jgi:O-antigen/teichoic acid export membrane protein
VANPDSQLRAGSHLAASQLFLSLSSLAVTSFVVREGDKVAAAAFFGAYALESIGVSAARGYTMMTLISRSATSSISRADAYSTIRASLLIGIATASTVFLFVLVAADQDLRLAAGIGFWCLAIQVFDSLRPLTGLFGSSRGNMAIVLVNLAAQVGVSVAAARTGLIQALVLSAIIFSVVSVALVLELIWVSDATGANVLQGERSFARSQLAEQGGSASLIAVTTIVLAAASPTAAVALQLANQLVTTPVLLLLNSAGMAALRQISQRALAGDEYGRQRNQWMLVGTTLFIMAAGFAVLEPGLLSHFFGESWEDARALAPSLALFSWVLFLCQVASHPYRSFAPPQLFRNWTFLATFVTQLALVLGGLACGVPGLAGGYLVAAAGVIVCFARLIQSARLSLGRTRWRRR